MSSILIDIARRRQRPGSGSILEITKSCGTNMLNNILSVPYAIIGGQATKSYMPERTTLDWDVLVHASDVDQAREEVMSAGAIAIRPLTIPGFTCRLPDSVPLDVISEDADWVGKALAEAKEESADDHDPVLGLKWLVLLKLKAGRVQDLADISRMMGFASDQDIKATEAVVSQWLEDASEDLASLVQLGQMERGQRS
jgi:hypothetical protein